MKVVALRNFSAGRGTNGQLRSFARGKEYDVQDDLFKKAPAGSFKKVEVKESEKDSKK